MNPADVGQSVLPLTSSDLSIFGLFMSAHFVVKAVMIGLLIGSVWVWAIVIDKTILYARTRSAMERFEKTFWSGQSLEELYRTLSGRPTHSMAALFVAAMREWKRSFEGQVHSFAGLQMRIEKVMDVTIAREIERLERRHSRALEYVSEATYRVWRLYMAASALEFESGHLGIYQVLASKRGPYHARLPLTRRHLYDQEDDS